MEKKCKIFITGHRGMVGSALLQTLKTCGYQNIVTASREALDLCNQAACQSFFQKEKPDIVIHAAGKVGGIKANSEKKAVFIYDNVMMAANLVHSAYASGVKKLINLGSSCIYPKEAPQPIREADLLTGKLEPTNEAYAVAKITAVKLCQFYREQYGCNFFSAMPCNLYGPGDSFDLDSAHVLPMFIRKFHLAKLWSENKLTEIKRDFTRFGNSVTSAAFSAKPDLTIIARHLATFGIHKSAKEVSLALWGSGNPKREFLWVGDLARAVMLLLEKSDADNIDVLINVGAGKDLALNELAKLVYQIVGGETSVSWDHTHPDGTLAKCLDISKISQLGWQPEVSLTEGIARVYRWYLNECESN